MYFEAAKWGKNSFVRYLAGFIVTVFGYAVLGGLPLFFVLFTTPGGMNALDGSAINPTKLAEVAGSKNAAFLLLTSIFVITMACFWFVIQVIHEKRMKWIATGAKNFRWNQFWFAFIIGAIAVISSLAISYFSSPGELQFRFDAKDFGLLVLIAAIMIPIQAGWEELFFRGYLMQGLGIMRVKSYIFFIVTLFISFLLYKVLSPIFASIDILGLTEILGYDLFLWFLLIILFIIIYLMISNTFEKAIHRDKQGFMNKNWKVLPLLVTTLLFAVVHMANPEVMEHGWQIMFPMYAIMGLSFGLMVLFSDGLELAMGYHIANNFWLALLMSSPESVLQTDSLFYTTEVQDMSGEVWGLLFFNVIILAIFAWRYGWAKNWQQSLFGSIK